MTEQDETFPPIELDEEGEKQKTYLNLFYLS